MSSFVAGRAGKSPLSVTTVRNWNWHCKTIASRNKREKSVSAQLVAGGKCGCI